MGTVPACAWDRTQILCGGSRGGPRADQPIRGHFNQRSPRYMSVTGGPTPHYCLVTQKGCGTVQSGHQPDATLGPYLLGRNYELDCCLNYGDDVPIQIATFLI